MTLVSLCDLTPCSFLQPNFSPLYIQDVSHNGLKIVTTNVLSIDYILAAVVNGLHVLVYSLKANAVHGILVLAHFNESYQLYTPR